MFQIDYARPLNAQVPKMFGRTETRSQTSRKNNHMSKVFDAVEDQKASCETRPPNLNQSRVLGHQTHLNQRGPPPIRSSIQHRHRQLLILSFADVPFDDQSLPSGSDFRRFESARHGFGPSDAATDPTTPAGECGSSIDGSARKVFSPKKETLTRRRC